MKAPNYSRWLFPIQVMLVLSIGEMATAQCLEVKLTAADTIASDRFGRAVDADGEFTVMGAIFHGEDSEGAAYVFRRDSELGWVEEAELVANDADPDDQFGFSVGISDDAVIVGATGDDQRGFQAGAAYIFRRDKAGAWAQEAKLIASDGTSLDSFGFVAIDGDTAVVGADGNDDMGGMSGSAYIFKRNIAGNWIEEAKLTASDGASLSRFGASVAVDGDTVAIGAFGHAGIGAAYVFRRDKGRNWSEEAKLTGSDPSGGMNFAWSISLDQDTVVVGAPQDNDAGGSSGSVYLFSREKNQWTETAKLAASDAKAMSSFGHSVSVRGDTFVGCAFRHDTNGAAYLFRRQTDGQWLQESKLGSGEPVSNDQFGYAVSLGGDYSIIGARLDEEMGENSGAAYVFDLARPECRCFQSTINDGADMPVNTLFLNGSVGSEGKITVPESGMMVAYILLPPAGGNGKFLVHANMGAPTTESVTILPGNVGTFCFPVLFSDGASPIAVWNNFGRVNEVGSTHYFDGTPLPDPPRAPAIFLQLFVGDPVNLPAGTTVTFQGGIVDPGTAGSKGGGATNALIMTVE